MIVRISEEAQFDLPDALHDQLNDLDDATVAAVEAGDESGYYRAFEALLDFVRSNGSVVGDDDLRPSEIILPPSDLTFREAGEDFTGEGLVPDPA
ncbi:PspA-associated protein PspAA [Baekduia sp. Peel2402]|uniref:PspA-associated protein PspAA n=1 Tax=Baekduia sp. Peel2402 TaxID=3458296 RepID=UPI00403E95A1